MIVRHILGVSHVKTPVASFLLRLLRREPQGKEKGEAETCVSVVCRTAIKTARAHFLIKLISEDSMTNATALPSNSHVRQTRH